MHEMDEDEPKSLHELYDPEFGRINSRKYIEQLLYRDRDSRETATDVAEIVLNLDESELSSMLAFSTQDETHCFMASESGIWTVVNRKDKHEIKTCLVQLSDRLNTTIIKQVEQLICRLSVEETLSEARSSKKHEVCIKLKEAKDHLRDLLKLFKKLRSPPFNSNVIKQIITMRVMQIRAGRAGRSAAIRMDMMDGMKECIGFKDGVFDFKAGKLKKGVEARAFLHTQTTRYDFESIEDIGLSASYDTFMKQVLGEMREYVVSLLASSVLGENRQVMVVHHNVAGSNGKSTFFMLVKRALGDLFMKCDSKMLAVASHVSASGPNEELISCKGKRLVLVSEPSASIKLSSSFIKELTGGDEQSTRATYGKKQTFVFRGVLHVLCNKIPEVDDMCGGMQRRLRCIPYGSRFTEKAEEVDVEGRIYAMDPGIESHLDGWKYCLMKEVMDAAIERVRRGYPADNPPREVIASTTELIERESTVSESERKFAVELEMATGVTFKRNVRPDWLKNPSTRQNLELDFYSPEHNLAVEYDDHYVFPNNYHSDRTKFEEGRSRDALKDALCRQQKVTLVRVRADTDVVQERLLEIKMHISQG